MGGIKNVLLASLGWLVSSVRAMGKCSVFLATGPPLLHWLDCSRAPGLFMTCERF